MLKKNCYSYKAMPLYWGFLYRKFRSFLSKLYMIPILISIVVLASVLITLKSKKGKKNVYFEKLFYFSYCTQI